MKIFLVDVKPILLAQFNVTRSDFVVESMINTIYRQEVAVTDDIILA